MFTTGANYSKLKTNLRLVVSRLKLLEKKKTELTQKARREIAEYLNAGKVDRARIRVEHIIREDYLVEAMEVVEMYCDLLLARFGLIQQMKTLDEGLAEAISSVIWVAPRLQADVAELKIVADQLAMKYGKPYAQAARENSLNSVNEKLMHKLSVQAPPKILVEKYLIEISKSHNINYEPDLDVLKEDELLSGDMMSSGQLIDFGDPSNKNNNNNFYPPPGGGGGGGGMMFPGGGGGGMMFPGGGACGGNPAISYPFPSPIQPNAPLPSMPPAPFCYPEPVKAPEKCPSPIPPLPAVPPSQPYPPGPTDDPADDRSLPPPYETLPNTPGSNHPEQYYSKPPAQAMKPNVVDTLPELPAVPNSSLPGMASSKEDDVDFDELTRRFEDLKKRK